MQNVPTNIGTSNIALSGNATFGEENKEPNSENPSRICSLHDLRQISNAVWNDSEI